MRRDAETLGGVVDPDPMLFYAGRASS